MKTPKEYLPVLHTYFKGYCQFFNHMVKVNNFYISTFYCFVIGNNLTIEIIKQKSNRNNKFIIIIRQRRSKFFILQSFYHCVLFLYIPHCVKKMCNNESTSFENLKITEDYCDYFLINNIYNMALVKQEIVTERLYR